MRDPICLSIYSDSSTYSTVMVTLARTVQYSNGDTSTYSTVLHYTVVLRDLDRLQGKTKEEESFRE